MSGTFTVLSVIMFLSAYILPNMYETGDIIKEYAKKFIIIASLFMPAHAFNTCCYFILRAGGKILLTVLFDCVFIMVVRYPVALILCKYTTISIFIVYFIVDFIDFVKAFWGYLLVDGGSWLKKIVIEEN